MLWVFRLPPTVYLLLAPLGLVLAGFLYFDDQKSEADKAIARAAKPPAEVRIEQFQAARNTGPAHEVNILGQVDVTQMVDLTRSKKGSVRDRWVLAPIYATTATDTKGPAIGLMVQHGSATDDQLGGLVVANGPVGPIMRLNGLLVDRSKEGTAIDEAGARIKIAPNAIFIDPFEQGRAAGLAASSTGRDAALFVLVIALLIGGFGAFRWYSTRDRDPADAAEGYI